MRKLAVIILISAFGGVCYAYTEGTEPSFPEINQLAVSILEELDSAVIYEIHDPRKSDHFDRFSNGEEVDYIAFETSLWCLYFSDGSELTPEQMVILKDLALSPESYMALTEPVSCHHKTEFLIRFRSENGEVWLMGSKSCPGIYLGGSRGKDFGGGRVKASSKTWFKVLAFV